MAKMNEEALLAEYPLLTDKVFTIPKRSICNLMDKDDYADDRGHIVEFCDTMSDNNDEMFFYEMIRALEFILENATAYTTPDKRICLNYPNTDIVPMDKDRFRRWYFVYCHECLHQLWDTFAVGDQIKKDLDECNYQMLNVASDCVINEYLTNDIPDGKLPPIGGITAQLLKDKYNIEYSRKNDTQYSLYLKLKELSDQQQQELSNMAGDEGQGQSGQGQSGQGNSGGSQSNGSGSGDSGDQGNSGNNSSGSTAANAKKKLEEAQKKLDEGDTEGAKQLTQEAKSELEGQKDKLSDEGKKKLDGANGKDPQKDIADLNSVADEVANNSDNGKSGEGEGDSEGNGDDKSGDQKSSSNGAGSGDGNLIDRQLIEENRAAVEKICKKYAQSMTGNLGEFLNKCKSSKNMEEGGLLVQTQKAGAHWNKELLLECDQYIHQRLRNRDKKYKRSRKRFKRGETAFTEKDFKDQRILKPGKEEIKDQMGFDMALYIDVSGSMSGCIDRVFDAAYDIVETLKKNYSHDKLVDASAINMKSYVFTDTMREIPFGKKCRADGGTYSFERLLNDVKKRNANAFLNIVITDGDFGGINKAEVTNALEDMDGLFVVVSNKPKGYFSDLVNHVKRAIGPQLADIYADSEFTID